MLKTRDLLLFFYFKTSIAQVNTAVSNTNKSVSGDLLFHSTSEDITRSDATQSFLGDLLQKKHPSFFFFESFDLFQRYF